MFLLVVQHIDFSSRSLTTALTTCKSNTHPGPGTHSITTQVQSKDSLYHYSGPGTLYHYSGPGTHYNYDYSGPIQGLTISLPSQRTHYITTQSRDSLYHYLGPVQGSLYHYPGPGTHYITTQAQPRDSLYHYPVKGLTTSLPSPGAHYITTQAQSRDSLYHYSGPAQGLTISLLRSRDSL